jgi:hypothetical protein
VNTGQFNGFAFNAGAQDPVVRIHISAMAYARGRARPRVHAYAVVQAQGRALQHSHAWRVESPLRVDSAARAAIDGALGRVDVRSLLAATGRVQISLDLPAIRARVRSSLQARATLTAHVMARIGAQLQGVGVFTPRAFVSPRGRVDAKPTARVAVDGVVYMRRYLRATTNAQAQALVLSTGRIYSRLAALTHAQALPQVQAHTLVRTPLNAPAVVLIELNPDIHKRLPFDEAAPEVRTFKVPAGVFTFYVTD